MQEFSMPIQGSGQEQNTAMLSRKTAALTLCFLHKLIESYPDFEYIFLSG